MGILTVYKGTDKDMKCRDMQYELGKTETDDGAVRCGNKGFHSCEAPLDVLRYYPANKGNRYFAAEAGGMVDRKGATDTKLASSELTLKAEIGLPGLIRAQVAYTRKKAESGTAGGDYSNLAGGESSLLVGRNGCKAKAKKNSVIVLAEWKWISNDYTPVSVKAVIVDGEQIKEDVYYTLKDGELVECQ